MHLIAVRSAPSAELSSSLSNQEAKWDAARRSSSAQADSARHLNPVPLHYSDYARTLLICMLGERTAIVWL